MNFAFKEQGFAEIADVLLNDTFDEGSAAIENNEVEEVAEESKTQASPAA